VKGNLNVFGKNTTIDSENVLINDRHQIINANLISNIDGTEKKENSGFIMNFKATNTLSNISTTFDATNQTITFKEGMVVETQPAGSFLMVINSAYNDGIYIIKSVSGTVITVNIVDEAKYITNNVLTNELAFKASISYISLSVIRTQLDGSIEISQGTTYETLNNNYKTIMTAGGDYIFTDLELTGDINQLMLNNNDIKDNSIITVTTDKQGTKDVIYKIPNVESSEFVMAYGEQNIYNKTIKLSVLEFSGSEIPLVLQINSNNIINCLGNADIILPPLTDTVKFGTKFKIKFSPDYTNDTNIAVSIYLNQDAFDKKDSPIHILDIPNQHISLTHISDHWYVNL
jgi:hypothetical protein